MRKLAIAVAFGAGALFVQPAIASELPDRGDIEAVCDKFGPTNEEFCELVLGIYDSVDDQGSRVGDLEGFVGRIPEHPHPAFGYDLTQRTISELRSDVEAGQEKLEGLIGRVPEHPHPAFGYNTTKGELAELRAAIEALEAK